MTKFFGSEAGLGYSRSIFQTSNSGYLLALNNYPKMLDVLKRNMSRGNSLSDELILSSVLGDTRAYVCSPFFKGIPPGGHVDFAHFVGCIYPRWCSMMFGGM